MGFGLLQAFARVNSAPMNILIHISCCQCVEVSLGYIAKSKIIGHKIYECLTSGDNGKLFSKVVLPFYSHKQCQREPLNSHPLQHLKLSLSAN